MALMSSPGKSSPDKMLLRDILARRELRGGGQMSVTSKPGGFKTHTQSGQISGTSASSSSHHLDLTRSTVSSSDAATRLQRRGGNLIETVSVGLNGQAVGNSSSNNNRISLGVGGNGVSGNATTSTFFTNDILRNKMQNLENNSTNIGMSMTTYGTGSFNNPALNGINGKGDQQGSNVAVNMGQTMGNIMNNVNNQMLKKAEQNAREREKVRSASIVRAAQQVLENIAGSPLFAGRVRRCSSSDEETITMDETVRKMQIDMGIDAKSSDDVNIKQGAGGSSSSSTSKGIVGKEILLGKNNESDSRRMITNAHHSSNKKEEQHTLSPHRIRALIPQERPVSVEGRSLFVTKIERPENSSVGGGNCQPQQQPSLNSTAIGGISLCSSSSSSLGRSSDLLTSGPLAPIINPIPRPDVIEITNQDVGHLIQENCDEQEVSGRLFDRVNNQQKSNQLQKSNQQQSQQQFSEKQQMIGSRFSSSSENEQQEERGSIISKGFISDVTSGGEENLPPLTQLQLPNEVFTTTGGIYQEHNQDDLKVESSSEQEDGSGYSSAQHPLGSEDSSGTEMIIGNTGLRAGVTNQHHLSPKNSKNTTMPFMLSNKFSIETGLNGLTLSRQNSPSARIGGTSGQEVVNSFNNMDEIIGRREEVLVNKTCQHDVDETIHITPKKEDQNLQMSRGNFIKSSPFQEEDDEDDCEDDDDNCDQEEQGQEQNDRIDDVAKEITVSASLKAAGTKLQHEAAEHKKIITTSAQKVSTRRGPLTTSSTGTTATTSEKKPNKKKKKKKKSNSEKKPNISANTQMISIPQPGELNPGVPQLPPSALAALSHSALAQIMNGGSAKKSENRLSHPFLSTSTQASLFYAGNSSMSMSQALLQHQTSSCGNLTRSSEIEKLVNSLTPMDSHLHQPIAPFLPFTGAGAGVQHQTSSTNLLNNQNSRIGHGGHQGGILHHQSSNLINQGSSGGNNISNIPNGSPNNSSTSLQGQTSAKLFSKLRKAPPPPTIKNIAAQIEARNRAQSVVDGLGHTLGPHIWKKGWADRADHIDACSRRSIFVDESNRLAWKQLSSAADYAAAMSIDKDIGLGITSKDNTSSTEPIN